MRARIALLAVLIAGGITVTSTRAETDTTPFVAESEPVVAILPTEPEPEAMEDYENDLIEEALLSSATRIDNVTITHYCTCKKCCGKSDGITASGRQAVQNVTVAVDPKVIPLGSDVLMDYGDGEIHYYRADDTGGAIKGNHIDLCVSDHQTALNLGVRTATVYWVKG